MLNYIGMSKVLRVFTDQGGEFSWRKIMTAMASAIFAVASVGYLIKNDFDELPSSYQAIIAGVFAFYFMKSIFTIDKYSIVAKETENGKGNDGKEKKQKN